MFNPTFWAVTQPLGQNNSIAGFVHILPALEVCTGFKLKPEPGPYPRSSDPTRAAQLNLERQLRFVSIRPALTYFTYISLLIFSRNRDIYCSWINSASPCCVVGISSAALPPCRISLTGCRCRPEAASSFQTRPHQWCSSSSWRCVWAGFGLEGFASGSCRQWPWPAAQEHDLSVKNKHTFRRSWVNVVVKHERRGLNKW